MSRKPAQPTLHLDSSIEALPIEDIRIILRGADPLIAVGGRSLLLKILRGSRAKDVLTHGLDDNPSYGAYRERKEQEVRAMIDWTILHGYMRLEFSGDLPMLAYTRAGWAIERDTIINELIRRFDCQLAAGAGPYDMLYLKDRDREMIFMLIEKLRERGDRRHLPLLEDWERVDYRKVREEIRRLIAYLGSLPA